MPSDVLSIALSSGVPGETDRPDVQFVAIDPSQRGELAHLYLASYPPHVGAADLEDARREMDQTFAGEFGALRTDASWLARKAGEPAGAILVAERSIWDDDLHGPFVIDLFVRPQARGCGLGRALVFAAMRACRRSGDIQLSLRVGEGTSAAAHALYASVGFTPLAER